MVLRQEQYTKQSKVVTGLREANAVSRSRTQIAWWNSSGWTAGWLEGGASSCQTLVSDFCSGRSSKTLGNNDLGNWRWPTQPHPGTRINSYRCSLPGLAGFTIYRCEGTGQITITRDLSPLQRGCCCEGGALCWKRGRQASANRPPRLLRGVL